MRQVTCDPKRLHIEIGVGTAVGEVRNTGVGTSSGEVRKPGVGTAAGEVCNPGVGTAAGEVRIPDVGTAAEEVRNPGVGSVAGEVRNPRTPTYAISPLFFLSFSFHLYKCVLVVHCVYNMQLIHKLCSK